MPEASSGVCPLSTQSGHWLSGGKSHFAVKAASAAPVSCATMNSGHVARSDAGEGVGQAARDGDRRVGEAGRGGEPVSGGDVERDRGGHPLRPMPDRAEDGQDQPEGGDGFADPLAEAGPSPSPTAAASAGRTSDAPPRRRGCQRRAGRRCRRRRRARRVRGASAATRLTAGFMCAPEIGPSIVISTNRIAPVAIVLPSRAMASFPPRDARP